MRNRWLAIVAVSLGGLVVKAGCGAPEAVPAETVDVELELAVMLECAAASIEQATGAVAARHDGLRWVAGRWAETPEGRARVTARVFVHPAYGPGITVRVQREQWAGTTPALLEADAAVGADGSGWDAAPANEDDPRREQEVVEATRTCWLERREQ